MTDPRYEKLAKVLVEYCLDVQKKDLVLIRAGLPSAPLVREVYREVLQAGGHPLTRIAMPGGAETFYGNAKKHQLEFVSPVAEHEIDSVDKLLAIRSSENTKSLTNVDPEKQKTVAKAQAPLRQKYQDRVAAGELEWCVTQFPCNASAQDAEMSLEEYEDFVFKGGLLDKRDPVSLWRKQSAKQAAWIKKLGKLSTIRIVGKETDLTVNVAGRTWIN